MIEEVKIYHKDEVFVYIDTDKGIFREMVDYFSFEVPNAKFHPLVKNKVWDGKIKILNPITKLIYKGLIPRIVEFCNDRDYTWSADRQCLPKDKSNVDYMKLIESFNLKMKPYDYQIDAFKQAINNERILLLSPTSSGKSFILYMIVRLLLRQKEKSYSDKKILITVPNVGLIHQIIDDFKGYSDFPILDHIHAVYQGQEKNPIKDKSIVISTWQSIYKLPNTYFDQFAAIMADEAHTIDAKCAKGIFEKARSARYKIGCTGTVDGERECHALTIEGLTGKSYRVTTTQEMISSGKASKVNMKCLILRYPEEDRIQFYTTYKESKSKSKSKEKKKANELYNTEYDFVMRHEKRNRFIGRFVKALPKKDNTLILTKRIEHIDLLAESIQKENPDRTVLRISGEHMSATERNDVRGFCEKNEGIILVASFDVYSKGINIKNLQNLIFASSSKSMYTILQSIGRLLRLDGKTNTVNIFDIADDLSYKGWKNYMISHLMERIKIYRGERYIPKTININVT